MKKTAFVLFMCTLLSCESEVKFNDPAFQALKNNVFWKAGIVAAVLEGNFIVINAQRADDLLVLKFPVPTATITKQNPKTYTLGTDEMTLATYSIKESGTTLLYTTGENTGNGEIIVNEFDVVTKKISATFIFSAIYQGDIRTTSPTVNFQDGFIFRLLIK